MKARIAVGAVALGLALMSHPAQAQVVQAGVVIRSGPVYGHVVVAIPCLSEPPRRVYVERPAARRGGQRRGADTTAHAYGWWFRAVRAAPVVVYYDGARYYTVVRRASRAASDRRVPAWRSLFGATDLLHAPSRR